MSRSTPIEYRLGNDIDLDAFIDVYRRSTLGERRPVDDRARMKQMLESANLTVSAWDGSTLVGIARSLSDYCYATYLSDLAVDISVQRRGIGRELVRRTRDAGGRAAVFLFAAPSAIDYYEKIGFRAGSGWVLMPDDPIT